jgi:hypothetical protein
VDSEGQKEGVAKEGGASASLFYAPEQRGNARQGQQPDTLNGSRKVAIRQAELTLPPRRDESEESAPDREERLWTVTLRYMTDAADEIGRDVVCHDLAISETTLSRQLREVDGKNAHGKLLAYLIKNQRSGRLATWLMRDYAGYLPPARPDRIKPEDFARQIAAMALGGEFGAAERQKVLSLYERVEIKREEQ